MTPVDFLEVVRRSSLVEAEVLDHYLQKVAASNLQDPRQLAGLMVREGVLTSFQAQQLLTGKYKGFVISGRYKVLERLGAGGMSVVYLCEHLMMRRKVAIKVLPPSQASNENSRNRFYREAQAVASLDHPNIVRAHDVDCDKNLHFLVMEYIDGISLQDLVKRRGPLDPTRAAHFISHTAHGLQHAHEAGLVHRDIKPGNLLLDRNGVVKILDMGLALFFRDENDSLTQNDGKAVLGTVDYLSPEQAVDSHNVDIRADIYSLGATFYYLLTGQRPFQEGTTAQKLLWHQVREPQPIAEIRPDVPPELIAIVQKMMAKNPNDRFQTPAEVEEALRPWTLTPVPPPSEEDIPRRNPVGGGGPVSAAGPRSGRMPPVTSPTWVPASGSPSSSSLSGQSSQMRTMAQSRSSSAVASKSGQRASAQENTVMMGQQSGTLPNLRTQSVLVETARLPMTREQQRARMVAFCVIALTALSGLVIPSLKSAPPEIVDKSVVKARPVVKPSTYLPPVPVEVPAQAPQGPPPAKPKVDLKPMPPKPKNKATTPPPSKPENKTPPPANK